MKGRSHTFAEKAKFVLEILRGESLLNEIASENGIRPNVFSKWKKRPSQDFSHFLKNLTIGGEMYG